MFKYQEIQNCNENPIIYPALKREVSKKFAQQPVRFLELHVHSKL